jgi:hypothetical protein
MDTNNEKKYIDVPKEIWKSIFKEATTQQIYNIVYSRKPVIIGNAASQMLNAFNEMKKRNEDFDAMTKEGKEIWAELIMPHATGRITEVFKLTKLNIPSTEVKYSFFFKEKQQGILPPMYFTILRVESHKFDPLIYGSYLSRENAEKFLETKKDDPYLDFAILTTKIMDQ